MTRSPATAPVVSRFEGDLLTILQGFLGHVPQSQLVGLLAKPQPRPPCLAQRPSLWFKTRWPKAQRCWWPAADGGKSDSCAAARLLQAGFGNGRQEKHWAWSFRPSPSIFCCGPRRPPAIRRKPPGSRRHNKHWHLAIAGC